MNGTCVSSIWMWSRMRVFSRSSSFTRSSVSTSAGCGSPRARPTPATRPPSTGKKRYSTRCRRPASSSWSTSTSTVMPPAALASSVASRSRPAFGTRSRKSAPGRPAAHRLAERRVRRADPAVHREDQEQVGRRPGTRCRWRPDRSCRDSFGSARDAGTRGAPGAGPRLPHRKEVPGRLKPRVPGGGPGGAESGAVGGRGGGRIGASRPAPGAPRITDPFPAPRDRPQRAIA